MNKAARAKIFLLLKFKAIFDRNQPTMKVIFSVLLFWIAGQASAQNDFIGEVTAVIDGNTLEIKSNDNQIYKVVLAGIDSPEPGQTFSDKAHKLLEKLMLGKKVSVKLSGKDRLGNYVATVMKGDLDPRTELLEEGLAWTAERNPIPELEAIRVKAKEKAKGLWKEENPTPPWIFRRQQSMMQAKSS
jgi:micrococcal nuclease